MIYTDEKMKKPCVRSSVTVSYYWYKEKKEKKNEGEEWRVTMMFIVETQQVPLNIRHVYWWINLINLFAHPKCLFFNTIFKYNVFKLRTNSKKLRNVCQMKHGAFVFFPSKKRTFYEIAIIDEKWVHWVDLKHRKSWIDPE